MDLFIPPGGQTKNWYVRVYIPSDLKGHFGNATEFRQSMKTTDKVEAMARAGVFITAKAGEFKKKRAEIAVNGEEPTPTSVVLDQNLIRSITSVRFTSLLDFDEECRNARGEEDDPEDMEAVPKEHMPSLVSIIARRRGAPGYKAYVDGVVHIARVQGHEIARDDPLLDELVLAMAMREKRAFEVMQNRNAGEDVRTIKGEGGPWLRDILGGWESESTAHMEPKTKSSYKSRIESFIEFVHNKPGHQVEQKDVHNWLLHLLNREKRARKTLMDGYLPALKSLFKHAVSSGKYRIVRNPADGVLVPRLSKKQEKSRARPRFPFPTTYVNLIFSSDWYAGNSNKLGLTSKTFVSGGARYWIPLIFMSHGFRPEEICQMTLHDVGVQGGALAIQVTDEGDKQAVKNDYSKRWVPVHKLLVELGFAEYVAEQRKRQRVGEPSDSFRDRMPNQDADAPRNAGRLFPEVASDFDRQANAFSHVFSRFIHNKLKFESAYKLYSFRHLWEDRKRETMAVDAQNGKPWPPGMEARIGGRAPAEKKEGTSAAYGRHFRPDTMKPFLDSIGFPGIVLPCGYRDFMSK